MDLYINGTHVAAEYFPRGTLEETIREVQRNQCRPDQLVVGVTLDGEEVAGAQLPAVLKQAANSFERLDLVTATKARLVLDAMEQASDSLNQAEDSLQQIAAMLIEGQTRDAITGLGDCTRAWQQINESIIRSIELLQIDPEQMQVRDATLVQTMLGPKETLVQIRDALAAQDHVLLADLLQLEFTDALRQWHAVIAAVRHAALHQHPT